MNISAAPSTNSGGNVSPRDLRPYTRQRLPICEHFQTGLRQLASTRLRSLAHICTDQLKAKFHYASWFGAGSELVRSWFEAGSKPVADQLLTR